MAFSRLVYEAEAGGIERIGQEEELPFNTDLKVQNIRVGDDGEWVVVNYLNTQTNSEGSLMIPKERVIRLGGPDRIS